MSPRRSQTDEPQPEVVEQEAAAEEATVAPQEEGDVAPLVEGAPVSAAARQAARYGTT